jgi:hypothetical protein
VFDALMFLSGAVLFFLTVLFFIYNWWERSTVTKRRVVLDSDQQTIKEKNAEIEIWQKELQVWHNTLEREQKQLEEEREEFRMLVASQDMPNNRILSAPQEASPEQEGSSIKGDRWGKNTKTYGARFDHDGGSEKS